MSDTLHTYSEIFYSIQGEGMFTGHPTAWLRLFACNLSCEGFGQKDPTLPETYHLPYKDFDVSTVKKVEDLPVWEFGCDSSYSWSAKYKRLAHKETAKEIVDKIESLLPMEFEDRIHMCFTGGEPLLPKNQTAVIDVLEEMGKRNNKPGFLTFETNGTQQLGIELSARLWSREMNDGHTLFSVSPKLWTVAGERPEKAIKPKTIASYLDHGYLQLKFVMGKCGKQWGELEYVLDQIEDEVPEARELTWIMPVGGTREEQDDIAGEVATKAIQRGYKVAARVHCYLWGNKIGT